MPLEWTRWKAGWRAELGTFGAYVYKGARGWHVSVGETECVLSNGEKQSFSTKAVAQSFALLFARQRFLDALAEIEHARAPASVDVPEPSKSSKREQSREKILQLLNRGW